MDIPWMPPFTDPLLALPSSPRKGWPKFVARQFALAGGAGLAAVQYFDSRSTLVLADGNKVVVTTKTRYPFEETVSFAIEADRKFDFSLRIPAWCKGATVTTNGAASPQDDGAPPLPAGAMHSVAVAAGSSTLTLTLPMEIRVARRPAYAINATVSVATNAANVYRGPLLYAIARDFILDHAKPYKDGPALLPIGQAHGQDNYLLGTGSWNYALRISDDTAPAEDLTYVAVDAPEPPKGQGPFSAFLVPGHIKAKAQIVADWGCAETEYGGRGAPHGCSIPEPHKSIPDYTAVWAGLPPKSPVNVKSPFEPGGDSAFRSHSNSNMLTHPWQGVTTPLVDVVLLPMGATDLRVAEFPTTSA